ncbi:uncharacterized protein LOC127630117 isoform X2 [Xyrauchen texanus]|uniref:uncharacterized protein LOC127630117 isoform X2 n=1 Tax=Xyrauchen texanus TaxID=154827 RepID=UPI002241A2C1|nr:uncharacterized protein LOC127630117 isoform X2 [Xyrauchen texanus]
MDESDDKQQILTILSWNVNGFNHKKSEIFHHLSLLNADVVFLQETHVGPDRIYSTGSIKIEALECNYDMAAFTVFKGSSRGVAVLFKKNLGCGGFKVDGDIKGRYIIISCQICGHDFVFINVYNSNDEKIMFKQFAHFSTQIPPTAFLVVGGDFNTVMDADLDKTSNLRNRSHRKSFDSLQSFLETFNLVDVWRCVYPEIKSFTYFDGKGQSRLDYFFLQSHNLTSVTACRIYERPQYTDKEDYVSDHAPLSIQIQVDGTKMQFDSFLLKDKACMEQISRTIKTISGIKTKRKRDLWPGVKVRLFCEAIALQNLSRCSDTMQTFELPEELEHMEPGESYIEVLHTSNGSCTSRSLLNFLDHLHQTERFEEIKLTLNAVLCESVSRKEILVSILSLPQSDCLTSDGLTVHFYIHFASKLVDLLQGFFNQILDLKPIKCLVIESPSQGNYDHTYCCSIQHYCSPISVINVDYKILALILADRLSSVIKHVLNPGQSNPHASVQDFTSALQIPMLIVTLKVDPSALKWPYLFNSLKSVNLPDRFRSVLELLLMTEGGVNSHRHTRSDSPYCPTQGLKEECPLTPLLISICLHPLIYSINCEQMLLGPTVQGEIPKSVIDKDRAFIFLCNTSETLDSFETMLHDFTETSGFIIDDRYSEVFVAGTSNFSLGKDRLKLFKRTDNGFHCDYFADSRDCGIVQEERVFKQSN